ncbi:hypothetical protein HYFRA_00010719 [Hymenoscyphus fraxineus]|uniref:Uncharacterized protein n=1 Tax=Hymenoscyphus fraxineus TaxID=746836 RepID=A0A9N9L054_9HELO|nr:hypothetical protein HYFRA_00010719 [Hymenoscyphus fraxineus]
MYSCIQIRYTLSPGPIDSPARHGVECLTPTGLHVTTATIPPDNAEGFPYQHDIMDLFPMTMIPELTRMINQDHKGWAFHCAKTRMEWDGDQEYVFALLWLWKEDSVNDMNKEGEVTVGETEKKADTEDEYEMLTECQSTTGSEKAFM